MKTTFYRLIERYPRIEIPVIQRDYAQGRKDQCIVGHDFLNSLQLALTSQADTPLDLDFVYGSVINGSFQPLDGQQRLTTLFLLHWYLAWVDGQGEDFRNHLVTEEGRSRFGYEVRPSSREFFNAFAVYVADTAAADCSNIIEMVTDQSWFFRSWRLDPTIQSALSMLEKMHNIFRHTTGLYARLTDEIDPSITFQLLNLEQFGLSEDLYIKMNARGKLLTPFETFKARFEQHLQKSELVAIRPALCGETPIPRFFSNRIDGDWSDFFWPFRDERTATFDDAVMNLVRAVIMVTRSPNKDSTNDDLVDLRSSTIANSYAWFHEKLWLDEEMIVVLITLLERWNASSEEFRRYLPDSRYMDEKEYFDEIIKQPTELTFQQLVVLAGYVQYLVCAEDREIDPAALNSWMRVVFNLAANTDYNRPNDLRRSFDGLRKLKHCMKNINCYLAKPGGRVEGFSTLQVAEERIKARLIELGVGWAERIDNAEQHNYFRGQIGFLLRFCQVNLNDNDVDAELNRIDAKIVNTLVSPFEHYFYCAEKMFEDIVIGRGRGDRLWERALLAVGDFLLPIGRNHSLLMPAIGVPWSWKRLLRNAAEGKSEGQVLKNLWDRIGVATDFATNLTKIIEVEDAKIDLWRKSVISTPAVYTYGMYRMLRFEDGKIYILKKSQMNGHHAELFTYCLYMQLKERAELVTLTADYHETTSTDDEPHLYLLGHIGKDETKFCLRRSEHNTDRYELRLEEPQAPKSIFIAVLKDEGFEERHGRWSKLMNRVEMETVVVCLDQALAR